jgi:hypothetical protein
MRQPLGCGELLGATIRSCRYERLNRTVGARWEPTVSTRFITTTESSTSAPPWRRASPRHSPVSDQASNYWRSSTTNGERPGSCPREVFPADWRQRRTAVHVRLPPSAIFVDVDDPLTHQYLRAELAPALAALGVHDLDVSTVRGPDRRITQMISEWAYMAAQDDQPRYAGLRYCSRCWKPSQSPLT